MNLKYRKAVFVAVYRKNENNIDYLLLKRKLHWKGWEFPKGGLEKNELIKDAIIREVKEETGLKSGKIINHRKKGKYNYDKIYSDRRGYKGQMYSLYSCEVKSGRIKIDSIEHSDYKWLSYGDALKRLTHENQKDSLRIVNRLLKNGY